MSTPWWVDAVGYQVYLPSFADSDGDGWGDLRGVTAHLDHLSDLGVDIVWLTPFFASPMRDHGYDVSDYLSIDPVFGDDDALTELLDAAHRRGTRVIGDLVVNHTSDAHPWFAAASSAAGRQSPYRDYYLWRDPAPGGGPPNNWLSHFGGPAWTFNRATGQYYLHLFTPGQPDLNWRNPKVAEEVDAIMAHWFGRGLDGFRIDTAAYLLKHPDLPGNPARLDDGRPVPRGVTAEWARQDHRYDIHQPDVHAIHERWRALADRHDALLVGEVYELDPRLLAGFVEGERLHSSFWFGLVEADWSPGRTLDPLIAAASAAPRLSWVQSNHDRSRAVTRYGGGELGRRRSLALHVLMSVLPGTFWLYQGEELGLTDGRIPAGQGADPLGSSQPDQGRDGARTPMPWTPEPGLGFTTGRPWLPGGDRAPADTVAGQRADPDAHLPTMRRLLANRRWAIDRLAAGHQAADRAGDLAAVRTERLTATGPHVVAYRRGGFWAVANLDDAADSEIVLPAPAIFDTDDPAVSAGEPRTGTVRLAPQQAMLLFC